MMRHHQDKLLLFLTIAVALATFLPPGSVGFTAGGGKNIPGRKRGILQVRQTEKKTLVNNKAKTLSNGIHLSRRKRVRPRLPLGEDLLSHC